MTRPVRLDIPIPPDLRSAIDAARGLVPRAAWVREAIQEKLQREGDGRHVRLRFGPGFLDPRLLRDPANASAEEIAQAVNATGGSEYRAAVDRDGKVHFEPRREPPEKPRVTKGGRK